MKRLIQNIKRNSNLYMQILFTVMAFAAMAILSYFFMSNIVKKNLVNNTQTVLDFSEEHINIQLRESKYALNGFAESVQEMVLNGDSAEDIEKYINNISNYAFSSGMQMTGKKGLYGYFETIPGGPVLIHNSSWDPDENYIPEELEWYTLALKAGEEIIETVPYISENDGTLFTYARCIFDNSNRRIGVVCIEVNIDSICENIVNTALEQGGYGMLLNQELMLLAHPNDDFIGRTIGDPVVPVSIFEDNFRSGEDVSEQGLVSYTGKSAIGFFRRLSNGGYLGLVAPEEQYYSDMGRMFLILSLLGVSLAAVMIVILIRLDSAKEKSDEESRQKSAFLANMSHEIRTPINAIVGMTALGKVAGNSERKDYCFAKIDDASKHLLGVINDILDISKIEANKIELSETEFNFEKMLQHVVNVINFRADEKNQRLTVSIDKSIPKMLIADDQRFGQIITNLLSNAVKFTPENGSVSLKTSFLGEQNGFCMIKVEVTDNGIGMSPEQQSKLFRSFQQAESSTTRKYGGTGLGLSISKSIVELMGGEIWADSELGKGSTFTFTVKVKKGDDSKGIFAYQNINWGNIRILTVDDDQYILDYFQEIVSGLGARCQVAGNAGEAISMVEKNGSYNIYFVDLKMPEVDGIALTKQIRAKEKVPGSSIVIMISSADLSAVESDAKKAGVDKFLLKPLFPSSIADAISECIGIVNENSEETPYDITGVFSGYNVLLAEDIDINCEIVMSLLEPTNINIECAENGVKAVKMFSDSPEKYDLIFMDVQMPEMDGYEASRQIRALQLPNAATVPIIAMTANVFKEDIEKCLEAGMSGHLGKPLDMEGLMNILFKYLARR